MSRTDVMRKLEVLIADRAAPPGEKAAARARLDAIKSKYQRMSDAEIYAAVEMLAADVKRLSQKKEELRLFKAEGVRRLKKELKAITDAEVSAVARAETSHPTWRASHVWHERRQRFRKKVRAMTDAELREELPRCTPPFDSFVSAEIERRRWRRR